MTHTFEGTLDLFIAKNPQIMTQKGELRAEYKHANYIIQRMEQDEFFSATIRGKTNHHGWRNRFRLL